VVKGLVDSRRYRDAEKIVLVMDQLNTHTPASLYEAFTPDEAKRIAAKLEIHHTPKHGSWLNMAEIELSAFERDLPHRVSNKPAMQQHVAAWEKRRNESKVKVDWQFNTADARVKLRKLYPTLEG
jgi:DDE superfamily endonuclease